MTVKLLSIANDQTDSIKIDGLLTQVKYFNFQLKKIQDVDNILKLDKYNFEIIIWALNESDNADILLIIQNLNNSCNIPLILILSVAEHYKHSIAGVNYCLVWNEITPALLENAILYALNQHQIEATANLKQEDLELTDELSTIQDLFQSIVNNTSTFVWMVDVKGNFTFLNQAWLNFTGQTLTAGLQENWLERIHPDDIAECRQAYQSAQKKCTEFEIEYRLRRFDNEYRTILNTAVYRSNSQGDIGWLCFGLDITRRKKIKQQLIEQSHTDQILAKIVKDIYSSLNIDTILQTAANEINQFLLADRVFITKVTNNRRLNLLFESKLGDRCFKAVAQAITKVTKRPADLVARYGGEEFAVILPNTNILGAKYIAEQIRAKIEALKITHIDSKVNNYVTLSIGVTCCIPNRELSFMALIEAADKGLYKAKELGRNRVCEFEMNKLNNRIFFELNNCFELYLNHDYLI